MSENHFIPVIEMRGVNVAAVRDASLITVEGVNWTVLPGEFWVVAGQEHSGKTDLLTLAAGLTLPAGGSCKIFGGDVENFGKSALAERWRVGFVFENGQLFNQLTVGENVALPLRYQKNLTAAEAAAEVNALLESMELAPLADVTPANIAPNWRRRVALARALVLKPELLLLDNSLAGLGARHRYWWLRFLDQLAGGRPLRGGQPTTIVATADDLRPWQHRRHKFALLHDRKFIPLGMWSELETAGDPLVKELLAEPVETST